MDPPLDSGGALSKALEGPIPWALEGGALPCALEGPWALWGPLKVHK